MAIAEHVESTSDLSAPEGIDPRLRLLAETTRVLTSDLDADRAIEEVSRLVVPACADIVAISVLGDEAEMRPVALRHADPLLAARTDLLHELARPVRGGLVEAALLGESSLVTDVRDPGALGAVDHATRRCLLELDVISVLTCPLRIRDVQLGVFLLATTATSGRQLQEADRHLLCEIASRAGFALDHAQLFLTLRAAEHRFQAAFDFAPIGIALLVPNADGEPVYSDVNPAFIRILGRPVGELIGCPVTDVLHPDDVQGELHRFRCLLSSGGGPVSGEVRLLRPDGEVRRCYVHSARIDGGGVVTQLQDISEQHVHQGAIAYLATHDGLTGLLNRAGFETALTGAVAHAQRHDDENALLILDIDNFKHLNDTYGVVIGDEILRQVAQELDSRLRATDTIGRLGDDEFGVLLTRTTPSAAADVAAGLLECVRHLAMPVGERVIRPTLSGGLRPFARRGVSLAGDLITEATAGMLDAKDGGRDRVCLVGPDVDRPGLNRTRMRWSERIRQAVEHDSFALYEQPVLDLGTQRVSSSEVLLRMLGDDDEPIAPGLFIPAAERFGQMAALDRWVVEHAVELLSARREEGIESPLYVNLSASTLSDEALIDHIAAVIGDAGIPGAWLTFEITETAALGNMQRAVLLACRLRELGCAFALDDFGAGFSTFAYLKHLPVDLVKIDGQFIRELPASHVDRLTVRAIVDVARGLGVRTIAEFVADQRTLTMLEQLGVDAAQGFHVGTPRPAAIRPEWLVQERAA